MRSAGADDGVTGPFQPNAGQTGDVRTGVLHPKWAGGLVAAGAFAWWATGLRPFTDPPLVVVPLGGIVAMALGAWLLPPRTPAAVPLPQLVLWGALAGAVAVWQLTTFVQQPREEHPTMSSLINTLFESHPTRAGAFLLWLAGAAALARR
jgi:hypothetical protein